MEIDINGPEGNAYYILGRAKVLADQLELDWERIKIEMRSSDYKHLLEVFEKHFGEYCQLVGGD